MTLIHLIKPGDPDYLGRGDRERLPNRRRTERMAVVVGGQKVYVGFGRFPDGRIAEVFVQANKQGSALRGTLETVAVLVSIALQFGAPLPVIASALRGVSFAPDGSVEGDESIERCTSIIDYIGHALTAEEKRTAT